MIDSSYKMTAAQDITPHLMHVITRKRLNEFAARFPEVRSAIARGYGLMKHRNFRRSQISSLHFPVLIGLGNLRFSTLAETRCGSLRRSTIIADEFTYDGF